MNAISFSLFGRLPKYCHGAIRNAELVQTIYPGWTAVFYVDATVPDGVLSELHRLGAQVRPVDGADIANGLFWRFVINDDPAVERYLIRDADSRLNNRERSAVEEWIASSRKFHIMRDHPHHSAPIMGGMWGAQTGAIPDMRGLVIASNLHTQPYERRTAHCKDQVFLARHVWPIAQHDCLQHDSRQRPSFSGSVDFPDGSELPDGQFVGQVFKIDHQSATFGEDF